MHEALAVQILNRLRPICLALPDTDETVTFGHPTFQVHRRMFAVLEEYKGSLCLVIKVGNEAIGLFLEDPRFFRAPYIGKHGWVSLKLETTQDWEEIEELVRGSHEMVRASLKGKSKR